MAKFSNIGKRIATYITLTGGRDLQNSAIIKKRHEILQMYI